MNTETNVTNTNESEKLSELLTRLASTSGQDPSFCKEILREIERETSIGKNQQQHLVAKLAVAAAKTEEPFKSLLRWLDGIEATISPDTAIRGLLLDPELNKPLVPLLIAQSLVPDPNAGKGTFASRSLWVTPQFYKDLKKAAGESYARLGVSVWDAGEREFRSAEWCDAWTKFSMELLSVLLKKDGVSRVDLVSDYVSRIADADIGCASALSRFLLYLQTDIGIPNRDAIEKLRNSQVGRFFKKLSATITGNGNDEDRVADNALEESSKGPDLKSSISVLPAKATSDPEDLKNTIVLRSALPQQLLRAVERFCADLQAHIQDSPEKTSVTKDSVEKSMSDEESRQKLQKRVESLVERVNSSSEHIARIDKERKALNDQIKELEFEASEKDKLLSKSEESRVRSQVELDQLKEDYKNQDRRSEQLFSQSRQQIMLDLDIQLRDHWEMTSRMIELVIAKEREPQLLEKMWNELDLILWEAIGRAGSPVKSAN